MTANVSKPSTTAVSVYRTRWSSVNGFPPKSSSGKCTPTSTSLIFLHPFLADPHAAPSAAEFPALVSIDGSTFVEVVAAHRAPPPPKGTTMTATVATTVASTPITAVRRRSHPLLTATLLVGVAAAATTAVVAAAAHAAGVPLAIDGEQIPFVGFAQMTFLGAVLGGLIVAALNRWSRRARQRFQVAAGALVVLSCVPSVAMPPDTPRG